MSWLGPGIPLAPDSSACHIVLRTIHLLVPVFRSDSLRQSTTQARQILIVVDNCPLLVMPVPPVVLADDSLWVRPPHLIDLMIDLALSHPTMAVVVGALASDRPDEDGPDNDCNLETFVNTLSASNQPMLQQMWRVS